MKFGCHVSIRAGYYAAAKQAFHIGAKAYQYFPKNPRSLSVKDFDKDDTKRCLNFCRENNLVSIAHTPYPTSLTPSQDKKRLTIESLLNDLDIANNCGSVGVVVHFGSQISKTDPLASYQYMIEMLNLVLHNWDGESQLLIENNAGKSGTLGTTLEELVQVRNLTDYPEKIGFCLDTCHAFSSGLWDGTNHKGLWKKASELNYITELKAIHLNNSKYPTGTGKDRHANIFHGGYIEKNSFKELFELPSISNIPMVLETPSEEGTTHQEEISMLYQFTT